MRVWTNEGNGIRVVELHYSDDPAKDPKTPEGKEWLRLEKRGKTALYWAQEYEMQVQDGGSIFFRCIQEAIYGEEEIEPFDAVNELEPIKRQLYCPNCGHKWKAVVDEENWPKCRYCKTEVVAIDQGPEESGVLYYLGVDWASLQDYTVVCVLKYDPKMPFYKVVYLDRFHRLPFEIQKARIFKIWNRYNGLIIPDATGLGNGPTEMLTAMGLPVNPITFHYQNKLDTMTRLSLLFEEGRIKIPDNRYLIGELENYVAEQLPGGTWKLGAPKGMHDDCVTALGLAVKLAPPLIGEEERTTEIDEG